MDCGPCLRRPNARPIHAVVLVDRSTGRRTIVFSDLGVVDRAPAEITAEMIQGTRVLLLDHTAIPAGLRAAAIARNHAIPVVGDFERVADPLAMELMEQVDHLILGLELASALAGSSEPEAIVPALAGPQRACFAVTAGDQGCWYAEYGGPVQHVPALDVPVVDTTGCGDVFHGAYAAALAQGDGVHRAIHEATAAAGLKATQPGGRSGIPDRARVEAALGVRPR